MARKDVPDPNEPTLLQPESSPQGHATHENVKQDAQTIGETSGGFLGAVGGLSVGAIAGPVGAVLGAIAGAVGGWWAGHGIANAIASDDEDYFRSHYDTVPGRTAGEAARSFEKARPAYVAGHLAGRNPDYTGRSFDEVEGDLRRGWSDDVAAQHGDWPSVRDYARAAFDRARKP